MRSSTLAIFLVVLFITITLSFAEEVQPEGEATFLFKRQYGSPNSSSSIELSFMTFAIMFFTSLFAF